LADDEGAEVTIPTPPDRPGAGGTDLREPEAGGAEGGGGRSLPTPGAAGKVLLALALVVAAAAGAFWYLSEPADPGPKVRPEAAQTEIHDALDPFGYPAVLVDVTEERVLVRYEQPGNLSADLAYALARDTAALHANATDRVVVEAYDGYEPWRRWEVPTDVVLGFLEGDVSAAELEDETAEQEIG
jgi:hypothetical protein